MHQNILETLYQKLKKHQIMNLNYKLKSSIHIAIQKKIIVIQYFRYIYQNTGLHTRLKCMAIPFHILTISNIFHS